MSKNTKGSNEVPKAINSGIFILGTHKIEVVVLDNGQRIVTEEGMNSFLDYLQNGGATKEQVEVFCKALKGIKL